MIANESALSWELFDLPQLTPESSWYVHVPLARRIMRIFRPRTVVELGVFYGCSFGVLCEAAKKCALETNLYGVDTWVGDPHAGYYSNSVYDALKQYCHDHYPCAQLLRMDFNDALRCFGDKTIDLLHIDGYHTYQAVKDEYCAWLPKMTEDGIVLFHDISVTNKDFGVYKLWRDIRQSNNTISQEVWPGLGILFLGANAATRKDSLFPKEYEAGIDLYTKAGLSLAHQVAMKRENEKCVSKLQRIEAQRGYSLFVRVENMLFKVFCRSRSKDVE